MANSLLCGTTDVHVRSETYIHVQLLNDEFARQTRSSQMYKEVYLGAMASMAVLKCTSLNVSVYDNTEKVEVAGWFLNTS